MTIKNIYGSRISMQNVGNLLLNQLYNFNKNKTLIPFWPNTQQDFILAHQPAPTTPTRHCALRRCPCAPRTAHCASLHCICTSQYCTILHCTALFSPRLSCSTVQLSTVQRSSVLNWTVLYCTFLYCTVLYCTVQRASQELSGPDITAPSGNARCQGAPRKTRSSRNTNGNNIYTRVD